jgi:hypothetical protein
MLADRPLPTSARIVGWLFILEGAGDALDMIGGLIFVGGFALHSGVLLLFVGLGVLRGSDGWRRVALWLSLISMVGCFVAVALMLTRGVPVKVTLFGGVLGYVGASVGAGASVVWSAIYAWAASVLSSERTRSAFVQGWPRLPPDEDLQRTTAPLPGLGSGARR